MKKWREPSLINLSINQTNVVSDYINTCNWNEIMFYGNGNGNGNGEYRDPSNKPEQHPDWVWCMVHGMWHPKDHTGEVKPS